MLNIGLLPINQGGCGYYRMFIPFKKLEEKYPNEFKVEILFLKDNKDENLENNLNLSKFIKDKKIIVIQRRHGKNWENYIKYLQSQDIIVVYELDDTYEGIPYLNLKPEYKYLSLPETKSSICKMLDLANIITVTTKNLKNWCSKYCLENKVYILKNTLNFDLWHKPDFNQKKVKIIGFAGAENHVVDLPELGGSLEIINQEYNIKEQNILFGFFGYMKKEHWNLQPNVAFATGVTFLEYSTKLASLQYNIGLAPLKDCFFNTCKSELRFLEYSALGITTIASNIEPFKNVIKNNITGLLVKNKTRHWVKAMKYLINNFDECINIGQQAYKFVKKEYDINIYVEKWYEVYKKFI